MITLYDTNATVAAILKNKTKKQELGKKLTVTKRLKLFILSNILKLGIYHIISIN